MNAHEEIGGGRALAALTAPFPSMTFMPTGGLQAARACAAYLRMPSVFGIGASSVCPRSLNRESAFVAIRSLAVMGAAIVAELRPSTLQLLPA